MTEGVATMFDEVRKWTNGVETTTAAVIQPAVLTRTEDVMMIGVDVTTKLLDVEGERIVGTSRSALIDPSAKIVQPDETMMIAGGRKRRKHESDAMKNAVVRMKKTRSA